MQAINQNTVRHPEIEMTQRRNLQRQLAQIAAMILVEFRMQWRRRALLVITLAMLLIAVTPILLLRHEMAANAELASQAGELSASSVVSFLFIPIGAVLAMVVPFVMADVIPKDKQLGISDLLYSTPLTSGAYLWGKLLGSWLSVLSSLLIVIVPTGVLWRLLIGSFDLWTFSEPWIVGGMSMTIINVGLAVLLTTGQPDSRRAISVVVLVFILLPALTGFDPRGNWLDSFNPLRPGLFFAYTDTLKPDPGNMSLGVGNPNIELLSVETTIFTGVVQLGLVWIVAWQWLRRQMG